MAGIGSIVQYRVSESDTTNWGQGVLGADTGEVLPAVVTNAPSGTPAACNLRVFGNSDSASSFYVAGATEGSGNGEWSEL
jgi:hypothetical protein